MYVQPTWAHCAAPFIIPPSSWPFLLRHFSSTSSPPPPPPPNPPPATSTTNPPRPPFRTAHLHTLPRTHHARPSHDITSHHARPSPTTTDTALPSHLCRVSGVSIPSSRLVSSPFIIAAVVCHPSIARPLPLGLAIHPLH